MTLYEIAEGYRQLLWIAEDPEASTEALEECMGQLDDELEVKADSYITVIKSLESDSEMDRKEIKRLQDRVNTRSRNVERMKASVMEAMRLSGRKKMPTEHYKLSIAGNGGKAPLIITGDVPEKYCDLVPNNEKIREALDHGDLEFARLGERGEHLSVR